MSKITSKKDKILPMAFQKCKHELINVKNSIPKPKDVNDIPKGVNDIPKGVNDIPKGVNDIPKGVNDDNKWILEFSIVKIFSILEKFVREIASYEFKKIENCKDVKAVLDSKKFYKYIWSSSLDGKQNENLLGEQWNLEIKEIKRTQEIRNKIAHGEEFDPNEIDYNKIITLLEKFDNIIKGIEELNDQHHSQ